MSVESLSLSLSLSLFSFVCSRGLHYCTWPKAFASLACSLSLSLCRKHDTLRGDAVERSFACCFFSPFLSLSLALSLSLPSAGLLRGGGTQLLLFATAPVPSPRDRPRCPVLHCRSPARRRPSLRRHHVCVCVCVCVGIEAEAGRVRPSVRLHHISRCWSSLVKSLPHDKLQYTLMLWAKPNSSLF